MFYLNLVHFQPRMKMMILPVPIPTPFIIFHLMVDPEGSLVHGQKEVFWGVDHLEQYEGLSDCVRIQCSQFQEQRCLMEDLRRRKPTLADNVARISDNLDKLEGLIEALGRGAFPSPPITTILPPITTTIPKIGAPPHRPEIALLSQFEHENIVRYLGTDKDEAKLYIFLDLVSKGSLAQLYQRYHLQDSQASAYTRQILHGLKYLHDRNGYKMCQYIGGCKWIRETCRFRVGKGNQFNDVKSCKGTALWMAPEMQALFRIGRGEPPPVPDSLSKDARDFIHKCLQVKPDNRPTAAQLLEHPFVKRPSHASSGSASPLHNNWRR
ncbi:hypothetical protein GIB67_025886 [Kingdonia uniflora]|uniref:Protein kinase domain-containing protein n=1 Tax=Kingdonia uniflora TaxID=39325 RepID=A0A7J7LXJ0_9MAGN|nr:hypothetical protein GIB67_025886 [Kingdonia uniflora]